MDGIKHIEQFTAELLTLLEEYDVGLWYDTTTDSMFIKYNPTGQQFELRFEEIE